MPRKLYRFRIVLSFLILTLVGFAAVKFVSYARRQKAAAPSAAAITINSHTITDQAPGGNNDGNADPNETLTERVTFTNSGDAPANNVQLATTLNSVLAATGGTGNVSIGPIAVADTLNNIIPNVKLVIPTGANSLLNNDLNPSGAGALAVSGFGDTLANANANAAGTTFTSAALGSLKVNSDGSFDYNPPVGNNAQKQFFYTVTNGTLTSVGTVTLNFQTAKIWFINTNAGACAANCDGRLTNPFTSPSNYAAAQVGANPSASGDIIFLYESPTAYSGVNPVIQLKASQKLVGQDATASLISISGLTQPPGTDQLPAVNSANGTVVSVNGSVNFGVALSTNNTVRGLTFSGAASTMLRGTSFGTLVLGNNASPDVTFNGAGTAIDLTTGSFDAKVSTTAI